MYCPKCGHQIDENSKFCIHCGNKIDEKEDMSKSQRDDVQTVPAEDKQTEPTPKKKSGPLLIVIGIVAALIIVGVIAAVFLFGGDSGSEDTETGSKVIKKARTVTTVSGSQRADLTYNDDGNPTQYIVMEEDGTVLGTYLFEYENGKLIKVTNNTDGIDNYTLTINRDENGRIISSSAYYPDKQYINPDYSKDFEYWDNGKLKKTIKHLEKNDITIEFDESGKIIKKYDSKGDSIAEYTYDSSGHLQKKISYLYNTLSEEIIYTYDSSTDTYSSEITKSITKGSTGQLQTNLKLNELGFALSADVLDIKNQKIGYMEIQYLTEDCCNCVKTIYSEDGEISDINFEFE